MKKTPRQEIEEIAAIEHLDPTGLYDDVSVEGAIVAFIKYLKAKRLSLQEPEYNPQTYQGSYSMLGKEQMIDDIVEDLKKEVPEDVLLMLKVECEK